MEDAARSLLHLPRSGAWAERTEEVFGCVLLAMAFYFVEPVLPDALERLLMPAFLVLAVAYLAFLDPAGRDERPSMIGRRTAGMLCLVALALLHLPATATGRSLAFEEFSAESYDAARRSGAPFVIEFGAEWCTPCKEMEQRTFTDERVLEIGEGMSFLSVDMTTTDRHVERILESFDVLGAPTTLFFGPDGKEWKRKIGFIGPDEFADLLDQSRRPPTPATDTDRGI